MGKQEDKDPQLVYVEEGYPVAVKEGILCKEKPKLKYFRQKKTLILLIGLSDNKKIRKFENSLTKMRVYEGLHTLKL